MNRWKSRFWVTVLAVLTLLLTSWTAWQNARVFEPFETIQKFTVLLDGEYSLDGGEWRPIDNSKPIKEHFHKAVFQGRLIDAIKSYRVMNLISKNVWYDLLDANGKSVYSYDRRGSWDLPDSPYVGDFLKNTPGYNVSLHLLDLKEIYESDGEFTLIVEYPYEMQTETFSECFYVLTSYTDGIYRSFFFEMLPAIIMFLLVCFFGVFFFPIASGLLGKIDFRYIAFGALCFFAGLYMLVNKVSDYMNLWIVDSTVCMMTDKLCVCLFALAVSFYLRSLLTKKSYKTVATSVITVFFALTVTNVVLHMTNVADLMVSLGVRYLVLAVCSAVMAALLLLELRGKRGFALLDYLVSWVPFGVFLVIDLLDIYLPINGGQYLKFGLAVTILYQMLRFGMIFHRQYTEAIRYQKVQRELYEARSA